VVYYLAVEYRIDPISAIVARNFIVTQYLFVSMYLFPEVVFVN